MIKTHKWTIYGILIIVGVLAFPFLLESQFDFSYFLDIKWAMLAFTVFVILNLITSLYGLYQVHAELTLKHYMLLLSSPALFIAVAWYSLTQNDPIYGLILLGINSLTGMFTNSVYKQLIFNEEKFYYNRKIVDYDNISAFHREGDLLSVRVHKKIIIFKLHEEIHIEKTEENQDHFESIVSTLLSEHRHKEGHVA